MRGKRSKQYRRLMDRFCRGFAFREPYQVVLDAEYVRETSRCKMDLVARMTQVLHGQIKPIITQCSIRHLYAAASRDPSLAPVVDLAKTFERRRCGHRPDTHPEPLPEHECILSIVGPANRHRYVVASQDLDLRRALRAIPAVPLVYVNRSVTIMEPMAHATADALERDERAKFRAGLKSTPGVAAGAGAGAGAKRKRGQEEEEETDEADREENEREEGGGRGGKGENEQEDPVERRPGRGPENETAQPREAPAKKKRKNHGKQTGPNPLSVRKPKKRPAGPVSVAAT